MILTIVIPALNEEESIADIIERSLNSREHISESDIVDDVEVIVVSDGSTDLTSEIAGKYVPQVRVEVFEQNKGYGAAIKHGWQVGRGELLAFLDADGTCDPNDFFLLCEKMKETQCDIVIGNRMNSKSAMPSIRRFGNWLFAHLLTFLSSVKVKDTASGMRVVRRSCLKHLFPLPNGLHFTPAMSAKALLSHNITVSESDISYANRIGSSKLNILKDGFRFLRVIISTAVTYRPQIIINTVATLMALVTVFMISVPTVYYAINLRLEEWMIYRFIISELGALSTILLFSMSLILERTVNMSVSGRKGMKPFDFRVLIFGSGYSIPVAILSVIIGFSFIWDSLSTRLIEGITSEHWSRYIAFSFFTMTGVIVFLTNVVYRILSMLENRLLFLESDAE